VETSLFVYTGRYYALDHFSWNIYKFVMGIYIYSNVQQDATMSSQYFILLQYHSTCFECPLHPSSGVQETVVTATGIGHTSR
jgi:hypothetical protein